MEEPFCSPSRQFLVKPVLSAPSFQFTTEHCRKILEKLRLGLRFRMPGISEELLELEKKLLDPELRQTPEKLAHLLGEDFIEFGSSGHAYDKRRVLFLLRKQAPAKLEIEEFRVIEISPTAALVTYRAVSQPTRLKTTRHSLRSSLWMKRHDTWQMVFHQGTLVPEES